MNCFAKGCIDLHSYIFRSHLKGQSRSDPPVVNCLAERGAVSLSLFSQWVSWRGKQVGKRMTEICESQVQKAVM